MLKDDYLPTENLQKSVEILELTHITRVNSVSITSNLETITNLFPLVSKVILNFSSLNPFKIEYLQKSYTFKITEFSIGKAISRDDEVFESPDDKPTAYRSKRIFSNQHVLYSDKSSKVLLFAESIEFVDKYHHSDVNLIADEFLILAKPKYIKLHNFKIVENDIIKEEFVNYMHQIAEEIPYINYLP